VGLSAQNACVLEVFYEFLGGLFWGLVGGFEVDFWVGGGFVGVVDAGEVFDLACSCFFVEAFGVAGFAEFYWGVDEAFEEFEVCVLVDFSDLVAVGLVGGDERANGDDACVGEEFGDLADSSDVFLAVFGGEAEVVVEPVADIVAVESVGEVACLYECVFEGDGDGGFS